VNRAQRRQWRRGRGGLVVPDSQSVQVPRPPAPERLSHAEAREAFTRALVEAGMSREVAEEAALSASIRAVRREGYKL